MKKRKKKEDRRRFSIFIAEVGIALLCFVGSSAAAESQMQRTAMILEITGIVVFVVAMIAGIISAYEDHDFS